MSSAKFLKAFDKYFFGPIAFTLGFFRLKKEAPINPKKILAIRIWAVGDAIVFLPTLSAIKKKYPQATIDVLAAPENKAVFDQPFVNNVIVAEGNLLSLFKNFRKYDICIDTEPFLNLASIYSWYSSSYRLGFFGHGKSRIFHNGTYLRKSRHMLENYSEMAKPLGVKVEKKLIPIKHSKESENKIKSILQNYGAKPTDNFIGVCASVGNVVKTREWSKENWKNLCKKILNKKRGYKIILIGADFDYKFNEFIQDEDSSIINLVGKTKASDLPYLTKICKLFISIDTGAMHMAAAQDVKTIGLFGPNTPNLWAPYGRKHVSINNGNVCKYHPCIQNDKGIVPECYYKGTTKDKQCMKAISVDEVLKYI